MKIGKTKLLITFISAMEIFLYTGFCKDIRWIYIGIIIHLFLLIAISAIISKRKSKNLLFYGEIIFNYSLVFPIYNYWHSGLDFYLIFLYLIPLLLNYYISQNLKQLVILNINSMLVIGFTERGLLLYSGTLNEVETEGVVTLLTLWAMIMAYILSAILLWFKKKQIS